MRSMTIPRSMIDDDFPSRSLSLSYPNHRHSSLFCIVCLDDRCVLKGAGQNVLICALLKPELDEQVGRDREDSTNLFLEMYCS